MASHDDIPWLLDQLRSFAQFFGTSRSLFPDVAHAEAVLRDLITVGPFFVAEQDIDGAAARVGFISGLLAPHHLNPGIRVLTELFWWVDERYRNGRAGALLFNAYCEYGEKHADWVLCTLESNTPVKPETLERRGFHLHERSYLREIAA